MLTAALLVSAALAEAAAPRLSNPEPSDAEVRAARAIALAAVGEPSVERVQRAAAAQPSAEAARLESISRRARSAAWLPRFVGEFRHDERSSRVVGFTGSSESDYLRISPGDQVLVRATWELDRLIFTRDEISAAEAQSRLARHRDERVERATRLHFERLRLKAELALSPPASALERAQRDLELARATAELDALTGGLLSRDGVARGIPETPGREGAVP